VAVTLKHIDTFTILSTQHKFTCKEEVRCRVLKLLMELTVDGDRGEGDGMDDGR